MSVRILVPPGIGDVYWVLVKLRAFLRREGLTDPELTTICSPDTYGSETRSVPFLNMIPWLRVGNPSFIPNDPDLYEDYLEAYAKAGRTIWPGFMGYDYFLSYNGRLNTGGYLEATDVDLECEWYPEMIVSKEQTDYQFQCLRRYGRYVVFYWPLFGSFISDHLSHFSLRNLAYAVQAFREATRWTPVFVGSHADRAINARLVWLMSEVEGAVDLVGKTSLDELFGLLKGAQLVVGYHSGLTNMAVVFRKKTLLLWGNRLPPSIALSCFPPDTRGTTYHPLFAKGLKLDTFVGKMKELAYA